jgi:two-component sensor histidine kinase
VTHRAKNLLAVVRSIANLTAREGDNKSFVDRLNHRIAALAACHDLLVNSNWQGVDLDDLIRSQLRFYEDQFDIRIFAAGPPVGGQRPGVRDVAA